MRHYGQGQVPEWKPGPFLPLPIRTAREVFPQAAHPVSVTGVMGLVENSGVHAKLSTPGTVPRQLDRTVADSTRFSSPWVGRRPMRNSEWPGRPGGNVFGQTPGSGQSFDSTYDHR